jgi:hypothetical protein
MFAIVSYQSAFIVVNSALYFASKLIKAIKCFGFAVFVFPGGRSVDELSANITTISQELNTDATTIKHVSLVGCNLASNNPTDDNTNTYGAEMLQQRYIDLVLRVVDP